MLATKNDAKRGRLIYFAPPYMITAAPLLAEFVAEFLVNFFFVFKTRAATIVDWELYQLRQKLKASPIESTR